MKKFNLKLAATVMVCGAFLFSSCIGSFGLHSKLLSWNEGIGNKFVNELVYLAFNIRKNPIHKRSWQKAQWMICFLWKIPVLPRRKKSHPVPIPTPICR